MKNENKNRVGIALMLLAIVLFAGGLTFAFFRADVTGTQEKLTVQTGTLALTFSDNNTGITKNKLQLGESTTKEFKIENTGTEDVTTNMLWNNLINTYTEGSLTYTFEYSTNETGPWTAVPNASGNIPQSESTSDKNLAEDIMIPAHTTYYYQLTITLNHLADKDQTSDKTAILNSNFKLGDKVQEITSPEEILVHLNITPKTETPAFQNKATTDEGVFSMADDYGTSYYYRGAVENNYVKFAGFYWRIIRINGNGSLRMIYDGTVAHKNGAGAYPFETTSIDGSKDSSDRFIDNGTKQIWNAYSNDAKYVGYMYGGTEGTASTLQNGMTSNAATYNETSSNIKVKIDKWYENNLKTKYNKYIEDIIYCNDRSTAPKGSAWWKSENENYKGFGSYHTMFGAMHRLKNYNGDSKIPDPKFTCSQKNDAFTVSDITKGNGNLTYPIGLITADEIIAAGSGNEGNASRYYFLYKSSEFWYWTLSPKRQYGSTASMYTVDSNGDLNGGDNVSYSQGVAPVISIKAEYAAKLTGTGTASDPYTIPGVA